MKQIARRIALLIAAQSLLAVLACCGGPVRASCDGQRGGRADFGDFEAVPAPRIGGLPFPGIASLYAEAEPGRLGNHAYRVGTPFEGLDETDRGLVYTCRAGFIDLAHVRNTVDNAGHIHARLRHAMREGWGCVRYRLAEPSVWTVTIEYPRGWHDLDPANRRARADEAAIRAAAALGHHSMTWHEILTWFGYKSAFVIPEKQSAFTYEDTTSHAVGAMVARRALRSAAEGDGSAAGFGRAVTDALASTLDELGAVNDETTREAVRAVEGDWWSGMSVNRRDVRHGVGGEPLEPWRIDGFGPCDGTDVHAFGEPALDDLGAGEVGWPMLSVRIDPGGFEEGAVLRAVAETRGEKRRPRAVELARDVPLLVERIRVEVEQGGTPTAAR